MLNYDKTGEAKTSYECTVIENNLLQVFQSGQPKTRVKISITIEVQLELNLHLTENAFRHGLTITDSNSNNVTIV